jgi:hypothetical protein
MQLSKAEFLKIQLATQPIFGLELESHELQEYCDSQS